MLTNSVATMLEWRFAAVVSSVFGGGGGGEGRDEYGLPTFASRCDALTTSSTRKENRRREAQHDDEDEDGAVTGEWPLAPDSGYTSSAALCEAMRRLPTQLRLYTFASSWRDAWRYAVAGALPTFNRGYDVEAHMMRFIKNKWNSGGGGGGFATDDALHEATAWVIPFQPYLERVAAYPAKGHEATQAHFTQLLRHIQRREPDAWNAGALIIFMYVFFFSVHAYASGVLKPL